MSTLTPQQQTALDQWKTDTTQDLPDVLNNIFIDDCLNELQNNNDSVERLCTLSRSTGYNIYNIRDNTFSNILHGDVLWIKNFLVQMLLSRTPEGQAVMPFLDKKIDTETHTFIDFDKALYREFTEALRLGKGFYNALKIINKLYMLEIYA